MSSSSPMKQSTYTWSTPFFDIEFVDIRRAAGQGRSGSRGTAWIDFVWRVENRKFKSHDTSLDFLEGIIREIWREYREGQGRSGSRGTAQNQIGLELLNIKMMFCLVLSNHHKILDAHMIKVTIAFRWSLDANEAGACRAWYQHCLEWMFCVRNLHPERAIYGNVDITP